MMRQLHITSVVKGLMASVALAVGVTGCGGGGGGESGAGAARKVTAAMPISSTKALGGLLMTLQIPAGVTARIDPVTHQVASDVIQLVGASDAAKVFYGIDYVPATTTAKGQLKFMVVDTLGFVPGENISVQLNVTEGYFPVAGDFSITDYVISDLDGATTGGLTPSFTVEIL